MKKTIIILQPSYIPWLGYFDQINKSDIFIFFDDVQYTRRDWRNRNKIKIGDDQIKYLTVPIRSKGNYSAFIKDIEICNEINWQATHLGLIQEHYRKAPFFKDIFAIFKQSLNKHYQFLADLNIELTIELCKYLGINHPTFKKSSELNLHYQNPTDHLIQICKYFNGSDYITGDSAKSYLEEDQFEKNDIKLTYHGYQHPTYNQLGSTFIPYLSIIDLLFNEGPQSLKIL